MPGGGNPARHFWLGEERILLRGGYIFVLIGGRNFSAKCHVALFKKVGGQGDQSGTFCPLTIGRYHLSM